MWEPLPPGPTGDLPCCINKCFSMVLSTAVVVVVGYPTPSEGWGHGGRPWSPRSRETPQGSAWGNWDPREGQQPF